MVDLASAVFADTFSAVGLVLTGIGAAVAAGSVILRKEDAIAIGVPRFAANRPEENLKMPMVQNLLSASSGARRGLWLIVAGTAFQLAPVGLRLWWVFFP